MNRWEYLIIQEDNYSTKHKRTTSTKGTAPSKKKKHEYIGIVPLDISPKRPYVRNASNLCFPSSTQRGTGTSCICPKE